MGPCEDNGDMLNEFTKYFPVEDLFSPRQIDHNVVGPAEVDIQTYFVKFPKATGTKRRHQAL